MMGRTCRCAHPATGGAASVAGDAIAATGSAIGGGAAIGLAASGGVAIGSTVGGGAAAAADGEFIGLDNEYLVSIKSFDDFLS